MAKKPRKKWKGKELPVGVSSVVRNGSSYFYVRIYGKRKYTGKDDTGFKKACAAREKYRARKEIDSLYGLDLGQDAKRLEKQYGEFKTITELSNWHMEILGDRIEDKHEGRRRAKGKITSATFNRNMNHTAHLLRILGDERPAGLPLDKLRQYRRQRRGEGAAVNTIDGEIAVLGAMYRQAVRDKKIDSQDIPGGFPMEGVTIPRPRITDEQYRKLLAAAEDKNDLNFRDFMIAGFESGMRSGELCKLRVSQVVFDQPRIVAGKKVLFTGFDLGYNTKTGKPRRVPMSDQLRAVIERRIANLDSDDFVFSDKNGPYYVERISHKMKSTCKHAKLVHGDKTFNEKGERIGLTFHCFKVTRCTLWMEEGYSDELISMAVGTTDLKTLREHYVRVDEGAVMRLVNEGMLQERYKAEEKPAESVAAEAV